jgi:aspartate racemase
VLVPDEQDELMEIIKAVKRGETSAATRGKFARIVDSLVARGAEVLLVACTELSILSNGIDVEIQLIDSLDVLRDAVLTHAGIRAT